MSKESQGAQPMSSLKVQEPGKSKPAMPRMTPKGSQELDSAGLTADDRRTLQEMEETRRRAKEGALKQPQEGSRAGATESWNQDGGAA